MPPLNPEELEETFSEDEIPAKNPTLPADEPASKEVDMAEAGSVEVGAEGAEAPDDSEGGDDEPAEYVVEKIVKHKAKGNDWVYKVKWEGWSGPEAYTWEPEDNLENAMELVEAYWVALGGRPDTQTKGKKRKASMGGDDTPKSATRGRKKPREDDVEEVPVPKKRQFPAGSWEPNVATIETLEQIDDPSTGGVKTTVFLLWNGNEQPVRSQHDLELVRKKCPQKLIDFFINRLVFKDPEAQQNGSAESS